MGAAPVGVPVVAGVTEDAMRQFSAELERETQAAIRRVQATLNTLEAREAREAQRRRSSLDAAVEQAQLRISDAVAVSLDTQIGPTLRLHLEQAAGATELVKQVTLALEQRSSAHAAEVVNRVASDAAITRAIEARCMARVDERTRPTFWSVASPLLSAGAAVLLCRLWQRREER